MVTLLITRSKKWNLGERALKQVFESFANDGWSKNKKSVIQINGASKQEQLEHIAQSREESEGLDLSDLLGLLTRRRLDYYQDEGTILGVPTSIHHLPEAEEILPGHTLLRPSIGMLKSAVKFPHKDMVDGSGVYGNYNSIGMTWDGTNDRVVNTMFRRNNPADRELVLIPSSWEQRYQDGPDLS